MMELKELPTLLDYDNGETHGIPEGAVRINASGIATFFSSTSKWFRERLLGETGFTGNTASVQGTLVHYILERFAKNQSISEDDKQEIANYLMKHTTPGYKDYNPEIDINYIENNYKAMAETAVNDYLQANMPQCVEPFVVEEVAPGIFCGGSIDNITGGAIISSHNGKIELDSSKPVSSAMVVDYKTTSHRATSLKDKPIKWNYKLQLLVYAWILIKQGQPVDRIRIVYITTNDINRISEKTGKRMQDYPSTVVTQTEQITEEDLSMIEDMIYLIAESVDTWNKQPHLRHILAQDMRLKQN